jgi:YjbE family integral membrane protein
VDLLAEPAFWSALAAIAVINLVLSGDNAIVIALAARTLPKPHQRLAILWGTAGAVAVRIAMTVGVVWLLKAPGLMFIGGVLLAMIAYRLLVGNGTGNGRTVATAGTLAAAVRTIVIADAVMGVDNVLGVAGAAQGSVLLVVLGLSTSIPIVVWGSRLILKWMERAPWLLYVGGAVLAWTAGAMIAQEPYFAAAFEARPRLAMLLEAAFVTVIPGLAWLRNRRPALQSEWR